MVYKVHQFFLKDSRESECPTYTKHYSVARTQASIAAAYGIGFRTVQKIISEGKTSLNRDGSISFTSFGKHRKSTQRRHRIRRF